MLMAVMLHSVWNEPAWDPKDYNGYADSRSLALKKKYTLYKQEQDNKYEKTLQQLPQKKQEARNKKIAKNIILFKEGLNYLGFRDSEGNKLNENTDTFLEDAQ